MLKILMLVFTLGASLVFAQKATEQYIPIGKSPGLSNKVTIIGPIESVDPVKRTVTVASRTIKITDRTQIWLDRSPIQQTNQNGTFEDLNQGRKVECKLQDQEPKDAAEWIKIEILS